MTPLPQQQMRTLRSLSDRVQTSFRERLRCSDYSPTTPKCMVSAQFICAYRVSCHRQRSDRTPSVRALFGKRQASSVPLRTQGHRATDEERKMAQEGVPMTAGQRVIRAARAILAMTMVGVLFSQQG